MDVEQIIPLLSAESYLVSLGKRAMKAEPQAVTKRREKTISALQTAGILSPNTRLVLFKPPRPGLTITNNKAKNATFLWDDRVRWDCDDQVYLSMRGTWSRHWFWLPAMPEK